MERWSLYQDRINIRGYIQLASPNSSDPITAESLRASPSQDYPTRDRASNLSEKLSTLKVSTSSEGQLNLSPEEGGLANVDLEKRIRALRKKVVCLCK